MALPIAAAIALQALKGPILKTALGAGAVAGSIPLGLSIADTINKGNYGEALARQGGPAARSSSDSLNMYHHMAGLKRNALNNIDAIKEKLKTDKDNPELLKELQEWQESANAWDADMWKIGYELGLPGYRREFSPIFDPRNLGTSEQNDPKQPDLPPLDSEYENYDPFYFMKNLPNDPTISKNGANLDKNTVQNAASLLGLNNDYNLSLAASRAQQQRFWDNFKI